MAEGARLESVYTGNRIVGSNPTPSAKPSQQPILRLPLTRLISAYFGFSDAEPQDSDKPSASDNLLHPADFLPSSVLFRNGTVLWTSMESPFH